MSHDDTPACLRCWEHADCLEHPELAVACAAAEDRRVYPIHHHGAVPPNPEGDEWREGVYGWGYGHGKFMTDGVHFPPGDGGGYGYDADELSLTIRTDDFDIERMEGNYLRAIQNNCGSVG